MGAKTLNCPTCGASLASDEKKCRYCSSRLATIACLKCFGMMFVSSRFCPHCGERAERPLEVGPALECPDCRVAMKQILLEQTPLQECQRCYGLWVDAKSFERICADRERRADALGASGEKQRPAKMIPQAVRYRPCPQCKQLMNRFNFGRTSGIIIDKCAAHGIWFDHDELRRIVTFVHAGGLELSRQRQAKDLAQKRELQAGPPSSAGHHSVLADDVDGVSTAIHIIGDILLS